MVKCPYVPPHEWDLDFPHLMLRYRAVEHHKGMTSFADKELAKTDRNGKLGTLLDDVANIATTSGGPMRGAMQSVMGIDKRANLQNFAAYGMASCRERGGKYVSISVVAVSL